MPSYTRVLGSDPSLGGFGVCEIEFDAKDLSVVRLETIKTKPPVNEYARIERYKYICEKVFCSTVPDRFMVIEGYSFMAMGSAVTVMPELGGLVRYSAYINNIPYFEVTPQSVKKFGSGKGSAKKDQMMMFVQQNFGHHLIGSGFSFQDSNQTDAFVIAMMGVSYARHKQFGTAFSKLEKEVFKAMDKDRFYQLGYDSL